MNILFNIVVPLYNVERWVARNIRSIKAQKYQNYRVVLVNDMSTDGSVEVIEREIKNNEKFSLVHTEQNGGALNSTKFGINFLNPKDEDVIIVLDGDDWFSRPDSLDIVAKTYEEKECLMTYGSYIEYPRKIRGKFSRQIPEEILKNKSFRQSEWMTSHLRTFKYVLWRNIKEEDFFNSEGKVYSMAGDLPAMFPMLEMAEERSAFIEEIIHVYNRDNPLNEDKVNHELQYSIAFEVRNKPKYSRLEF